MLLFIGLDACLRPELGLAGSVFEQVPLLEDWLLARPTVYIVVSGQWRRNDSLDALRSAFSAQLRERVIGMTVRGVLRTAANDNFAKTKSGERAFPLAEDLFIEACGHPPGEREMEIWLWRASSDMAHHTWRALDDCPRLYSQRCRELIEVDRTFGITPGTLEALDEWLPLARSGS